MQLRENSVIRVRDASGRARLLGKIRGDTFVAFAREEKLHLFRNGAATAAAALADQTGAWGVDAAVMEEVHRQGYKYVEIPTPLHRYRTRLVDILGPQSYTANLAGQRLQYLVPLPLWVTLPPDPDAL